MNAVLPIDTAGAEAAWEEAVRSVNAWRGQALQRFAQAEAAVSETLLALAELPGRGAQIRLRRLIGQRFEDLDSAIGANGPFASEGAKAADELAAFRRHEPLRPFLCHGTTKITLDRRGQWLILIKVVSFRGRKADRSSLALEQREAAALLAELRSGSQRLASELQSLRARLPSSDRQRRR